MSQPNPDKNDKPTLTGAIPRRSLPTAPTAARPGQALPQIPRRPSSNAPIPRRPSSDAQHQSLIPKRPPNSSIPRKSPSQPKLQSIPRPQQNSSVPPRMKTPTVRIHAERPQFLIRVQKRGVPLHKGGITTRAAAPVPSLPIPNKSRHASASIAAAASTLLRETKRKRPQYLEDTDSDTGFLMDSDESDAEHAASSKKSGGRLKKLKGSKAAAPLADDAAAASAAVGIPTAGDIVATPAVPATSMSIEAPPPGVLANLWYSREQVLHVWSLEKIIGWKTRPLTSLVSPQQVITDETTKDPSMATSDGTEPNSTAPDATTSTMMKPFSLDPAEATVIHTKALANEAIWKDQNKRMEISRINHAACPVVLHLAAAREAAKAKREAASAPSFTLAQPPSTALKAATPIDEFVIDTPAKTEEEVLLVKWRGRSYMHCSWERKRDLEKFDPSNNTARGKIRRFIQSQHVAFGMNWKEVLQNERRNRGGAGGKSEDQQVINMEEEIFNPQFLEIERLLACDESEMNTAMFAKQRALNIQEEQAILKARERDEEAGISTHTTGGRKGVLDDLPLISEGEDPWDPEDYVRYVVKWKGMQYSEMTWEYWIHIKKDAVNQAEDFWFRQKAPDPEDILRLPPHPHMRDFRKLTESPVFAVSNMPRPVADLGNGFKVDEEDDEMEAKEFKLRSYQLEGVNWLLFNWWNRRSCILADEMGLGKTIQSTGFLHQLHLLPQTQIRGPFLIVAPLSLIGQWQSESQTWAPDMNVVFYHGSADAREFLAQQEFYYTDQFVSKQTAAKLKKLHVTKFHILITTYEVVLKDVEVLKKIRWKALIVDEAHRLKNPKSRLFSELASVPRDFCLLLTGTPLQNSTEELWALLHFADPIMFESKDDFIEKFGELSDAKQVSELHDVLKPYLLRRVKEDVEKSLPPKEETILEVTLTPIQKTYYKAIYERNTAFLFKGAKPSNAPSLMNVMMELRKSCNHPFLIRGAEDRIVADAITTLRAKKDENGNEPMIEPMKIFGEQLIKSSGKFVLLAKLLPKLYSGGHKVLIFSQMVRVLDLLEELLKWKKYRYERLDGSTNATSRASAVDRFIRKACQRFVMLLSTRAGGLGLNLTAADTVIIFDSDWNPQNDLQAMARSHRIGQTRPVRVYRLLTAKTYEMHMFHSASMKLGLDRAVLAHARQQDEEEAGGKNKKSDKAMQAKEIDALLKKGAYDVFRDDDDTEAKEFMETDIDQLLERSAKKVTYGNTNNSMSSGLGSFSKASFVADTGDGVKDVDLDDPDFWAKAVGLDAPPEEVPEDVAQMIDDGVKRSRKQVQVFDPFAEFNEAEQKKKDKIARKLKEEKEEKERARLARKLKKIEEKEKRKKSKEENKTVTASPAVATEPKEEKPPKEPKTKKLKKSERSKAQRRVENEDPTLERLKQAWNIQQRDRGSSSLIRFGFGRFCKQRNDSNLTSLPLQDLEIFVRAYIFQLALQVAVSIMKRLQEMGYTSKEVVDVAEGELRGAIGFWLGTNSESEISWICESVCSAAAIQHEVQANIRFLRMPLSLVENEYVTEMRKGPALRALRRVGILDRLNAIMEGVVDEIITALGFEEMGRRGCLVKDYSTTDADLKARHITSEELVLGLASRLDAKAGDRRAPAAWWDRSCDLGLIVGAFVHGWGNYEAMRNDEELPFGKLIGSYSSQDVGCADAAKFFVISTSVARRIFDAALECSKAKAQLEAHAAVAAAVAATKKAQAEGATDEPIKNASAGVMDAVNSLDVEADDLHMVTLPRLSRKIGVILRKFLRGEPTNDIVVKLKPCEMLPMPDSRVLDDRLAELTNLISSGSLPTLSIPHPTGSLVADAPEAVTSANEILNKSCKRFSVSPESIGREFHGLGFSGNQCGTTHRSLDDGSDYAVGSASTDLNFIATGNDGPRYLRALGVPINITRYAIVSAVNADMKVVEQMLSNEKDRNFGNNNADTLDGKKENIEEKKQEKSPGETNTKGDAVIAKIEQDIGTTVTPVAPTIVPHPGVWDNSKVRAGICAAALHYGCPVGTFMNHSTSIGDDIFHALQEHTPYSEAVSSMFTLTNFYNRTRFLASIKNDENLSVSESAMRDYLESTLLPHCLRLAVYGNGPTTRHTRVSKGTFETAQGHSLYPEPFLLPPTPLPDPTIGASEHSMEAVLNACAILRRVRLLRAAQYAVSGALPLERLVSICSSPLLCRSMQNLPLWWNPAIHDVALLVSVASSGMFGMLQSRQGTVFDAKASVVVDQIKRIVSGSQSLFIDESDEMEEWIAMRCAEFPTPNVLERRLALLCSEATKHLQSENDETCYYHLPMFDHGGWPRN